MNHQWRPAVKEEYEQTETGSRRRTDHAITTSSSSSSNRLYLKNVGTSIPEAMELFHDGGPPPFVIKTYEMVNDPITALAVSWSRNGQSFIVWDTHVFSTTLLPKYFKHSNFSSFVRQLNTYGFRKIDPDRWEFANEGFLMGHKHLLKYIKRRKVSSQHLTASCNIELDEYVGSTTDATETHRLKHDKEILMSEMITLRQQQENTKTYLHNMEKRIQCTEQKQRRIMSFIARTVQNSNQGCISQGQSSNSSLTLEKSDKVGDNVYELSELETLALEIQGRRKGGKARRREEIEFRESVEKELDEEFWEELISTSWLDMDTDTKENGGNDENLTGNLWAGTCTSSNKNSKVK